MTKGLNALKEMCVKKRARDFLVPLTMKIRSDPSWALWPFEIYWLIYHDKLNFGG